MKYSFVKKEDCHLPEILNIYTYYVENTTCTLHSYALNLEEMKELMKFDDERFESYVIIDDGDGSICGYVFLSKFKNRMAYDTTAEVSVYLKQTHTGMGVGKGALDFIEEVARKNSFHALVATVCVENVKSMRLFEGRGYEKCAYFREIGRKFDRWLDVAVYEKLLT
jgi:L-amino acid N-acyltransferase YncA